MDQEFTRFRANFADPKKEDEAVTSLMFLGFDAETAKQLVRDARQDGLKSYRLWTDGTRPSTKHRGQAAPSDGGKSPN
jgi:hypothetical protein